MVNLRAEGHQQDPKNLPPIQEKRSTKKQSSVNVSRDKKENYDLTEFINVSKEVQAVAKKLYKPPPVKPKTTKNDDL